MPGARRQNAYTQQRHKLHVWEDCGDTGPCQEDLYVHVTAPPRGRRVPPKDIQEPGSPLGKHADVHAPGQRQPEQGGGEAGEGMDANTATCPQIPGLEGPPCPTGSF
ncbi:hypothetical protein EI555_008780 [Monodon monoceros]|uniref:Uncharacterized protein n=1 Tax=Monodon monoceros TaxID=40151 RepID=A0A4U1FB98_MONMO|nr:hypothetical protein EI555_008780 [Monodon monoceros]